MAKKTEDTREYKTIPAFEVKIDEDQGIVEHLVSVFGVLDLGRDITHPGAFTKTISERADSIRVLDSHQRHTTEGVVGIPIRLWEVSKDGLPPDVLEKYPEATGGLMAETQFLMDTTEGEGVFKRIKAGAVKEFSFAYDPLDFDRESVKIGGKAVSVRNLRTVRLWEYGPVVFGMNPAALAVDSKGLDDPLPEGLSPEATEAYEKARSLSREVDRIRSAFRKAHSDPYGGSEYDVKEVFDEYVVVRAWSDMTGDYYKVTYVGDEDIVNFAKFDEWTVGDYVFVERKQAKTQEVSIVAIEIEQALIQIELAKTEAGPV